jgi:hypothetical protein
MRKRLFRSLGFLLSYTALLAFLLHPIHIKFDSHPDHSDHCCVCHSVPMGATQPQADSTPATYLVFEVPAPALALVVRDLFSTESPRGPPAA